MAKHALLSSGLSISREITPQSLTFLFRQPQIPTSAGLDYTTRRVTDTEPLRSLHRAATAVTCESLAAA